MEDASAIKRWLFHHFIGVARRCGAEILDGKPVALGDRLHYALGNLLVYGPLRNVLGMSRIRVAYTAGAAIGPDLFRFYRSIGINLKQLYGSTETCAYVCLQPDGGVKFDTVGPAGAARRSEDRRQRRGAGARADAAQGVLQAPRRDRRVDRRRTATSTPATPASSTPTASSRSSTARRTSASSRAARCSRPTTSRTSSSSSRTSRRRSRSAHEPRQGVRVHQHRHGLGRQLGRAARPRLLGLHRPRGEARGATSSSASASRRSTPSSPPRATLADSQIHRFLILHKELDPDDDELTRTRKVRRGFVAEKYAVLIDALYGGRDSPAHRDAVKFEDGRTRHGRRRPARSRTRRRSRRAPRRAARHDAR